MPKPLAPPRRAHVVMGVSVWTRELFQTWGLSPKDDRAPRPETCVFCKKIAETDPRSFVYQDSEVVVFEDWKPAARRHLLVCPREHITSARALTAADAGMARRMLDVGEKLLRRPTEEEDAKSLASETSTRDPRMALETRFGYHLPPFNSVDHLHMHCFQLPFDPAWKERKYSAEQWARFAFEPAEETCARLEKADQKKKTKSKL